MPTDALIAQGIPSFINGVSRQPAQQRLSSQAQEQTNVISDVALGVLRKPPTEHIALIPSVAIGSDYKFHTINRGDGQKFAAVIEDGDINVYNLDTGAEEVVNDNAAGSPGTYDYLDAMGSSSEDAFEAVTVADYTFILNKLKTIEMSPTLSPDRDHAHEFLLFFKVPGPDSSTSSVYLELGSTVIDRSASLTDVTSKEMLDRLLDDLCGTRTPNDDAGIFGGSANDFKFTRLGNNVLHGYQFQNPLVPINAYDIYGDTTFSFMATGINGEDPQVSKFSDLPRTAVDNFSVKVKGTDGNEQDDFYVTYSAEDHVWKESVKPGLANAFNADTMPHALIYDNDTGEFSFEALTWEERLVGDTLSAPVPSFVGKVASDIIVDSNRLTLISDENSIGGEAGQFFNFWPTTVTTIVDSDPIDVAGTDNEVSIWDYAIPFRGGVTLFSSTSGTIGELYGSRDAVMSIKNADISHAVSEAHSKVRPVAAGSFLYFLNDDGGKTSVYQYAEIEERIFRADEISSHVDNYLPTGIFKIAESRSENILSFLSNEPTERNQVYIYRFHFLGSEQAMSSWSRWELAANDVILDVSWIDSIAYLLIERTDGVHLEKIDLGKRVEDSVLGYRVHLDSLVSLTGVYDGITDETTWTLPYAQASNGGTYKIVKGGAWGNNRGSYIPVRSQATDGIITARGDYSAYPVYIGLEYYSTYELSEIVNRDSSGVAKRLSGRLQLRRAKVFFKETGTFDAIILSDEDEDEYLETYTSQFVNQAILGPTQLATGEFTFAIGGDSRNVRVAFRSNSFLPFNLSLLEWEGRTAQHSTPV